MSMHKQPLSDLERAGLTAHGLDIGTPSQLSDAFRQGVRFAFQEPVLHGMYKTHNYSHYDGGGGSNERLIAIDFTEQALRDRWNLWQKDQCVERAYYHKDDFWRIEPPFREGTEIRWNGSTGGGYASSSYRLEIKPYVAFDQS